MYFREHQQLQDEFHFGATLWTWRESCGDPHKAQDARRGTLPYVWGEFDVDCTTNHVIGPRTALLAQLDRAYVRAAPGRLTTTSADPATGALAASGDHARFGAVLVAWFPSPPAKVRIATAGGLRLLRVSSSGTAGGSYVTGIATRPTWSIRVTG